MNLRESLSHNAISTLRVLDPVTIDPDRSIRDAIALMQKHQSGCIIITENNLPIGIFTERDVLTKVVAASMDPDTSITQVMTSPPKTVQDGSSIADVIRTMHEGGFRHIPVVSDSGQLCGVISVKRIVEYLVEHFPETVFNLPPDPVQTQLAREGA